MDGASIMTSRPCLYCGDTSRKKTKEHVLQNSFGGSMTLAEDVCTDCNSVVFDGLDDEFVRYAKSIFDPNMRRRMLRENLTLSFDPGWGAWYALRLDNSLAPIVCPQIAIASVFTDPIDVRFSFDKVMDSDPERTFDTIVAELCAPSAIKLEFDVRHMEANDPPLHPIVVRTAHKTYLAVAGNDDEVQTLRELISDGKLGSGLRAMPREQPREAFVERPRVVGVVRRDFEKIERAIVKTAINYVCKVAGPTAARAPEFEAMRQYALHGGASLGCVTNVYGTTASSRSSAAGELCLTKEHALMLSSNADGLSVVLLCFAGQDFCAVTLGHTKHIPAGTLIITVFDPERRTHDVIDFASPRCVWDFVNARKLRGLSSRSDG
ncbi:HNH endonuclease [Sorangium sp. So ce542]|uniref:HNH endonuclease n=1 Tax=Sorangium sp. So ce542 TaxID=3133316 RepID=UPI003F6273E1